MEEGRDTVNKEHMCILYMKKFQIQTVVSDDLFSMYSAVWIPQQRENLVASLKFQE